MIVRNDQTEMMPEANAPTSESHHDRASPAADIVIEQSVGQDENCDGQMPAGTGMAEALAVIAEKLDNLMSTGEAQRTQLAELAARDEVLSHVHARLAAYERDDRQRSFVEPLVRKIAPLHRRLLEHLSHARQALKNMPRPLREHSTFYWIDKVLNGVRVELETVLNDFGVEMITAHGSRFDRSRQEAIGRVPTDDPAQVGAIARRVAPGFAIGERVVIAERVAVYVRRS